MTVCALARPTIRQATPADIPTLVALYIAAMTEIVRPGQTFSGSLAANWQEDAGKHLSDLAQRRDALILVADAASEVVGYEIAVLTDHRTVYSMSTYILPAHRRGWLARKLVDDALAWGVAHGCEWAECRTNLNSTAQRLLEHGGFRVVGVEMRKRIIAEA